MGLAAAGVEGFGDAAGFGGAVGLDAGFALSGAWVITDPASFFASGVDLGSFKTFDASDDKSFDDFSFDAIFRAPLEQADGSGGC